MTRLEEVAQVPVATPMEQVLEWFEHDGEQRILVVEDGRVMGIITPRDVARWVRRSQELGLPDEGD
jgi:CBS domain-containing protein